VVNIVEDFKKNLKDLDIDINEKHIEKFEIYKLLLLEWNEKINLTAITEDAEIYEKHFFDSLTPITTKLFEGNKKILDLGTGAGFPGIPLKLLRDDLQIVLMDSLNKRINFLNEAIKALKLKGISAIHGRAEELSIKPEYREQYDICISRAVASLSTLSEYCIPFVKKGGHFISMKGPDVEDELKLSSNAIKQLGGELQEIKYIKFPNNDIVHSLIIIEKIKETPTKYPRGGGKPRKNPL